VEADPRAPRRREEGPGFGRAFRIDIRRRGKLLNKLLATAAIIVALASAPARAQQASETGPKSLVIIHTNGDGGFGCQESETLLAIAGDFAEIEDRAARDRILAPLLRTGECSMFARGEEFYDIRVTGTMHLVRRIAGGPSYYTVRSYPP
jgi:hypothetical protein